MFRQYDRLAEGCHIRIQVQMYVYKMYIVDIKEN